MKVQPGRIYVTLVVAAALFACSAASQDKPTSTDSKAKGAGLSTEEMMKKAEAAGTPGPGHKALDSLVRLER
jgi:hypothetical protein